MNTTNTECCPLFNPEKWDQKTFQWDNKPFIKESMSTFLHIPFPSVIAKKVIKLCKLLEDSKIAEEKKEDVLLLFRDPGAFKSEIYLSVTGTVPGADNVSISGTFIAKVYNGPFNAVPRFIKQMNEYLSGMNKKAKDYYIHYAYCPKCAKKYGANYMIIFAMI
ncbi:MAG TPA: hypothetical protein PKW80_07295 [Bacteroidales bacterium]|nr:hypothetical protein [Bacteroidales bacterium]